MILIIICATSNVKDILGKLYFCLSHLNRAISNRITCFEIEGVLNFESLIGFVQI